MAAKKRATKTTKKTTKKASKKPAKKKPTKKTAKKRTTKKSAKKSAKKSTRKARKTKFEEFEGFPKKGLKFLRDLSKNNEREWFKANKDVFDEHVKAPLDAFVADVEPEFGTGKVFRIYRDVRFSKNKDPYKTHASAVFERDGLVFYMHIEPTHMFIATGCYQMQKDQLKRFYAAVDDDKSGKALERLVKAAEKEGYEIGGEALKNAARGYPRDHVRARFLKHKGLTLSQQWKKPAAWWHTQELGERVVKAWRGGAKLNAWLAEHVGPSEEGKRFVRR